MVKKFILCSISIFHKQRFRTAPPKPTRRLFHIHFPFSSWSDRQKKGSVQATDSGAQSIFKWACMLIRVLSSSQPFLLNHKGKYMEPHLTPTSSQGVKSVKLKENYEYTILFSILIANDLQADITARSVGKICYINILSLKKKPRKRNSKE